MFFNKIEMVSLGVDKDPGWVRRVPIFQRSYTDDARSIYFKEYEQPLPELAAGLARPLSKTLLTVADDNGGGSHQLILQERVIRDAAFHLGSGLSEYGTPPRDMIYPWRATSYWLWGAGFGLYLLLPRTPHASETIRYAAWLAPLGDFGAMLLFMAFFSLPLMIVGGSMQAVREWAGFPMFFWPLAGLGLLALWFSAKSAACWATVQGDRLLIGGVGGTREYPFSDMASAGNAIIKPPGWLIGVLWLSALTSQGTQRAMGVGQALILGGTQATGLRLTLHNGTRVYLWLTNAMGTMALKGCETLAAAIDAAGIPKEQKVEELRLLFPPDTMVRAGFHPGRWRGWITALLIVFGPALVVLVIGAAFPEKAWR